MGVPPSEFPFDLTSTELALLTMTNDGIVGLPEHWPLEPREPIILTTKRTYLWAAFIDKLLASNPTLDEKQLTSAYRNAVWSEKGRLQMYYQGPYWSGHWPPDALAVSEEAGFSHLTTVFVAELKASPDLLPSALTASREAYLSLERKGLVEDPLETVVFGIPLAVIGLVPYSFTQRTRGRTLYRKVTALFWQWEMRDEGGVRQSNFHFKLWKALEAFRRGLVDETEDAVETSKSLIHELIGTRRATPRCDRD